MERLLSICRLTPYPHTNGLTEPLIKVCGFCRGTGVTWSAEDVAPADDPFAGIAPHPTDKPCMNPKCQRGLVAVEGTLQSGKRGWTYTLRVEDK